MPTGSWLANTIDSFGFLEFLRPLKNKLVVWDPMNDPMTYLGICLALGFIQLIFGLCIAFYDAIRRRSYLEAFADRGGWIIFLTGLAGAVRPGTNLVVAAEGANPLADVFAEAIKTGAAAVHVLTPARVPGLADAEGRVVMSEVVAWINRPENQKSGMMKGTRIIARDANSVTKADGFLIIGLQKLSEAIAMFDAMTQ